MNTLVIKHGDTDTMSRIHSKKVSETSNPSREQKNFHTIPDESPAPRPLPPFRDDADQASPLFLRLCRTTGAWRRLATKLSPTPPLMRNSTTKRLQPVLILMCTYSSSILHPTNPSTSATAGLRYGSWLTSCAMITYILLSPIIAKRLLEKTMKGSWCGMAEKRGSREETQKMHQPDTEPPVGHTECLKRTSCTSTTATASALGRCEQQCEQASKHSFGQCVSDQKFAQCKGRRDVKADSHASRESPPNAKRDSVVCFDPGSISWAARIWLPTCSDGLILGKRSC